MNQCVGSLTFRRPQYENSLCPIISYLSNAISCFYCTGTDTSASLSLVRLIPRTCDLALADTCVVRLSVEQEMGDTSTRVSPAERLKAAVVAALQLKDNRSGSGGGIQIIELIDLIWKYALSTECMLACSPSIHEPQLTLILLWWVVRFRCRVV